MTDKRITFDEKAIQQILSSPAVRAELKRRADAIARAAGPGFEVDVDQVGDRAGAMVYTGTAEAMVAEQYHRALTRAIDAGRS